MKSAFYDDSRQLRRIEAAIRSIETGSSSYRQGKLSLLRALEVERDSLLQCRDGSRTGAGRATPLPRNRPLTWLNPNRVNRGINKNRHWE